MLRSIGDEENDGAVTDPHETGDTQRALGGGDGERGRGKSFGAARLLLAAHDSTKQ